MIQILSCIGYFVISVLFFCYAAGRTWLLSRVSGPGQAPILPFFSNYPQISRTHLSAAVCRQMSEVSKPQSGTSVQSIQSSFFCISLSKTKRERPWKGVCACLLRGGLRNWWALNVITYLVLINYSWFWLLQSLIIVLLWRQL